MGEHARLRTLESIWIQGKLNMGPLVMSARVKREYV
jgi:hypothetical protein